jgi:hypothetical protein
MRLLALAFVVLAGNAFAKDFTKSAKSGQATTMATYRSWGKDCSNRIGIVKVISKPAHGTLNPVHVDSTIGMSRRNPELTAHWESRRTDSASSIPLLPAFAALTSLLSNSPTGGQWISTTSRSTCFEQLTEQ